MASDRYTYAKATLPTDWAEKTASDVKIEIKTYLLDAVLRKRKDSVIREHIEGILSDFYDAFDLDTEREEAEAYRREIYAFAQEAHESLKKAVGNLTPSQFVAAVADPRSVSKQMQDSIGKAIEMDFSASRDVAKQIAQDVKSGKAPMSYSRATAAETYYRDVHRRVKEFMSDEWLKLSRAKGYGASVNPRNVAEMNVRFAKYQDEKKRLIDSGVRIVFVPSHSNCSERCQPYQGRVYSLDGTEGKIDGRRYIPIEDVSDKVTVVGKNGNRYYAGLFSYNCRHSLKPYVKGQNLEKIPKAVIDREREIEAKQRHMERQIRMLKEKEQEYRILNKISPNADILNTARAARVKARALTDEYERFSLKNNVPSYPERTRIVAGENLYRRTAGKNDPHLIKT